MSFFGDLGGAVSSIFGGIGAEASAGGYEAAADAYGKAARIATQNANLTLYSTQIQEAQQERKFEKVTGAETAATAGANLSGGTAGDLMRSSIQQGALARSVIQAQGAVNRNAFLEQATAYEGMQGQAEGAASAAHSSAMGGFLGGALGIAGALFSL